MNYFFYLFGAGACLYGMFVMNMAKSAVHEIEAFILFLIAAVLVVGGDLSAKLQARQVAEQSDQS